MTPPTHLQEVFDRLRRGHHLSPEDEPMFSDVSARFDDYAGWYAPLGLELIRHPREFFYFKPEATETGSEALPRIAVFAFILVDFAANQGRPIEEFVMGQHFLVSKLPHFSLDRYTALLRQVGVEDSADLRQTIRNMERIGWARFVGEDEFRLLRPFHRVLDRCIELAARKGTETPAPTPNA